MTHNENKHYQQNHNNHYLASLVRSKHPQNICINIIFKVISGKEAQNSQNYWGQGAIRQTAEGKRKL